MKNKNLLIVTYYFPPLGGVGVQRVSKFCKYLPRFGWNPVVVAPEPTAFYMTDEGMLEEVNHVQIHRVKAPDSFRTHQKIAGSRKPRIDSPLRKIARAFTWPDTHRGYLRAALPMIRRMTSKFQVILVTSPPWSNLLMIPRLKEESDVPIIADLRDPWVGHPEHDKFFWKRTLNKRAEREVLESADAVIAATRSHTEDLRKRYPRLASHIHYIPNGFDRADFEGVKPPRRKTPLTLCYTGILGLETINEGTTLYAALKRLRDEDGVTPSRLKVQIIGEVSRKEEERMKGVEEFIELPGFLPHRETMQRLAQADLAFLPYRADYCHSIVPAKTYEYIGSGTPVLAEVDASHETAELIRQTGTGVVIPEGDVDGMVDALRMLLKKRFPYKPNRKAIDRFDRRNHTKQLVDIIEGLTKRG